MKMIKALAIPAIIWFLLFVAAPICLVFVVSFLKKGTYGSLAYQLELSHWTQLFNPNYFKIIYLSLFMAIVTGLSTISLGLILAWAIITMKGWMRNLSLALITLPSFLNLIIRVFAIKLFVGFEGPLQWALGFLGISFDPFYFSQNQYLVFYGMFLSYLPFAFLPIYAALEKFDFSLVEAAQDLGAGSWKILVDVLIPSQQKSLKGAFALVFIPSLGEYVIPDLLGGAKQMYIGNLISEQFLRARDWPLGSSLASILILGMIIFLIVGKSKKRGRLING